jgi:hemolysin activation/secretion protein
MKLEQVGQDTVYTWQSAGLDVERGVGRVAGALVAVSLGAFGDRSVFSTGDAVNSTRWRARVGGSALVGSERRAAYGKLALGLTGAQKDVSYREGASGPRDVEQWIGEASLDLLVPSFGSTYYGLAAVARVLESEEALVPEPEQFTIGGARTVRGYREDQFRGPRVAYARNELRLGRTGDGLYAFVDVGYFRQQSLRADGSVAESSDGLAGYGFGVRSTSKVGRIDLSFAVGDEVSLQQTKVHVLLEQNF